MIVLTKEILKRKPSQHNVDVDVVFINNSVPKVNRKRWPQPIFWANSLALAFSNLAILAKDLLPLTPPPQ